MNPSMKKNIFLFFILAFAVACSPRKNGITNRTSQNFYTFYNTLFNGKEALSTQLAARNKSHKDNFYAPYISILTYDAQPLEDDMDTNPEFSGHNFRGASGYPNNSFAQAQSSSGTTTGATTLEIAENKAMKAIEKHSMVFNGVERNKIIFDAYILLAQARIYQDKPVEALDALNKIYSTMGKDKRIPLAKIYEALAFSKMKDDYRANEIFLSLKDEKLKKEYRKLKSVYYSELLLQSGKKEEAVAELENAYKYNKNKKLRGRIAFLRGQVLASLGKNEEARGSFVTAYKQSGDFDFEVKSQIEIAKTFNGKSDDYEGAKKYLEKISEKGTYDSRKNEFYYALGLMANKTNKKGEALDYFHKALKMKASDPQVRGLTFYEIGKMYFDKDDYLGAGAYYDSALAVMTYGPTKKDLTDISANLKNVSKNYYLIKKNDSILALTKMSDSERDAYFTRYINKIKKEEAQDDLERRKADRTKDFDTGDYNANSIFAGGSGDTFQDFANIQSKGFYFANVNTIAKGQRDFKKIWGDRPLSDDWRTSNHVNTLQELKDNAMDNVSAKDPRRYEPSFFSEKIPTDAKQIANLKKERDTASLGLGRMYEDFFSNTKLATKTLYDLVDAQPEEDVEIQALYLIFSMNHEKSMESAERAKQIILAKFPYTSYAEYVKNPKNNSFTKSSTEVEKMYTDAFDLYKKDQYEESKTLINSALEKYPKDALVPKFNLLNAFNTGKTAGKEIMILQLEQIALNYSKTWEGEKAKEMLKYLKSDLNLDDAQRDNTGNQTQRPPQSQPSPNNQYQQSTINQDGQRIETPVQAEEYEKAYEEFLKKRRKSTQKEAPQNQKN